MTPEGYQCATCGEWHDELPFSFHAPAPAIWRPEMDGDETSVLGSDQCIVQGEHFFVRGLILLPVIDAPDDFEWGVWVSLSEENFDRMGELWEVEGRESEPPYFGWLTTDLPLYQPSTLSLKTQVHTRLVGLRPLVELEPTGHPLAVEQRDGITRQRVEAIAAALLHS
ncbi:MAG TPA: DUF2199 domain-containing protein [Thermoleophilaceae bacterium]|nr:DUF2199 domain-containing protein [Thermoleophilaceae bacterium]